MLIDTNIIIYASKAGGEWLAAWTSQPAAAMTSITLIEALGYRDISEAEERAIRKLQRSLPIYALEENIVERAILVRRWKRMNVGDAIVAATALEYGLPLVTRNVDDFKHIAGLQIIDPFAAP